MTEHIPPHAIDIEKSVLGSMLIDNNVCETALEILDETCFYLTEYQLIFKTIREMAANGAQIDSMTVWQYLDSGNGRSCDLDMLLELTERVPTLVNIKSYCGILVQKSILRKLMAISNEIFQECLSEELDHSEILNNAESRILSIAERKNESKFESPKEILPKTFENIELRMKGDNNSGIMTGFSELDKCTGGFSRGELIILAGRPAMGKTALALSIAINSATIHEKNVAIFELEMTKESLIERALSLETEIDSMALRTGNLSKSQLSQLGVAANNLFNKKIFIDDNPNFDIFSAKSKIRKLKRDHGIDLLIIDYLQLIKSNNSKSQNRNLEIGEITRALKFMAKEFEIPILLLSQLSRNVEQRGGDKRPIMSDLRDSGSIEQDADVVMFIYREEVYFPKEDKSNNGMAEIIIGKQRNGPIGIIQIRYKNWCTKFYEQNENEFFETEEKYYDKF